MNKIRVYDSAIYVGPIVDNKRNGWGGLYYMDDDISKCCKIVCNWSDDKAHGKTFIYTPEYTEVGSYFKGVRHGLFTKKYINGKVIETMYFNGKAKKKEKYQLSYVDPVKFGYQKEKPENAFIVAELKKEVANGFGFVYEYKDGKLEQKTFCEFSNGFVKEVLAIKRLQDASSVIKKGNAVVPVLE